MRIQSNIQYGQSKRCRLDTYAPASGGQDLPLIVFVHGGGWVMGNHIRTKNNCDHLSERFNVVAVSYQLSGFSWNSAKYALAYVTAAIALCVNRKNVVYLVVLWCICVVLMAVFMRDPGVKHPTHIQDIATATRWATENMAYNGNIYLMGHSAGAHLASLLACHPIYNNGFKDRIKGAICLSGVYSPARLRDVSVGNQLFEEVFGVDQTRDAFPIYHVNEQTPPHLLLNAQDDISLKRHTRDFFFTLLNAGVYVRNKAYSRTNHVTICRNWADSNSNILKDITRFIDALEELAKTKDA